MDTKNVSTGKPKVGGAIHVAPVETALPKNAIEELPEAFQSLGYCSDAGLVNSTSAESQKAWGGDIVNSSKEDKFKYTLLETLNIDVLKMVYGKDNVSGTLETGITIKANDNTQDIYVMVIDMILKGQVLKRIVIPSASVSEVGDVSYTDTEATGYETTINAASDDDGNTHYEYIQKKVGSTNEGQN